MSSVPMEFILLSSLLGEAFHLDGVDKLFESTSVVEQRDSEKEEAQTINASYNPVECCEPTILLLRICTFAC